MQRALLHPGTPKCTQSHQGQSWGCWSAPEALSWADPGLPGCAQADPTPRPGRPGFGAVSYAGSERTDCIARPAGRAGAWRAPGGHQDLSGRRGWGVGVAGGTRGSAARSRGPSDRTGQTGRACGPERPVLRLGEERARGFAKPGLSPTPVSFVAAARPSMTLKRSEWPPRNPARPPRARSAQRRGAVPDMPRGETRGPGAGPGWWRSQ